MRRILQLACFVCLGLALSSSAHAQTYQNGPPPQHRLVLRDTSVFRWNPIGLITDARITYRFRLYENEKVALRDNFIGIGLAPVVSGGFARVGAYVEFQPTSFLQLWGNYEVLKYYGSSGFLQSWPDAAKSNYSDSEQKRLEELPSDNPAHNYAATGSQLNLGATLQLRYDLKNGAGGIILRDLFRAALPHYQLRGGDRVFYDIFNDVLAGNHSWYIVNDVDLGFLKPMNDRGGQLVAGLRWTMTAPFYSERNFDEGKVVETGNGPTHRVGPLLAYTFFQDDGAKWNAPTVLLIMNWWVKHEYRTGQDVSQAVPYFVLGFSFSSDFLGK